MAVGRSHRPFGQNVACEPLQGASLGGLLPPPGRPTCASGASGLTWGPPIDPPKKHLLARRGGSRVAPP
eukprot:11074221-Alexandrium_andersonii.AAC.1